MRPVYPNIVPEARHQIVRAVIHPAIGIARVGDSQYGYFIGPEVTGRCVPLDGAAHDESGALKRQAARFRIYGYDEAGAVAGEITAATASIRWTIHVRNKKASWYRFVIPMDIPEAKDVKAPLRNPQLRGRDRESLVLDPGENSIAGENAGPVQLHAAGFGTSALPVYLGELRTDAAGRLLVLGGRGVAQSPEGSPIWDGVLAEYPSGDGWHDDTSDGFVSAEVSIDGVHIPVESAWVVVSPPGYAPEITGVRTMYDLMVDLYVRAGWMEAPKRPSFRRDIYPIFQRLSALQWVNYGFAVQFGKKGIHDFSDPAYQSKLADPARSNQEFRRQLLHAFRRPDRTDNNPFAWPWLYGDAMTLDASPDTLRQHASISETQWSLLQLWAEGDFECDCEPSQDAASFETLSLQEQPAMLDRAALDYCLADAFHPGFELTWPMRHLSVYTSPFRIRRRSAAAEPDYGDYLTQQSALAQDGPLYTQSPGDLTRWLAVPWQVSAVLCRSGYDPEYDPYLPTFWPARVPNHVLTEHNYFLTRNPALPKQIRISAFQDRRYWTRSMRGSLTDQMLQMVGEFGRMGVVQRRPGVTGDPDFPDTMYVESMSAPPAEELADPSGGALNTAPVLRESLSRLLEQAEREAREAEEAEWQSGEFADGDH